MSIHMVFADDLTGACEIAGIAHRAGQPTVLSMDPEVAPRDPGATIVIDAETRLLPAAEAAARMQVLAAGLPPDTPVFQKTDSVLRGSVAAESAVLARQLERRRTLLVPANPGLARHIVGGRYHIAGAPLHETPFRLDPLHPATTNDVVQLVGPWTGPGPATPVSLGTGAPLPATGLIIGDATGPEDLAAWRTQVDATTLPAGSAAFFDTFLPRTTRPGPTAGPALDLPTLLLCGTTTPAQRALVAASPDAVPLELSALGAAGENPLTAWHDRVLRQLQRRHRALVGVDGDLSADPAVPALITAALAGLAASVAAALGPAPWHLVIEGGATAAAVASALHCRRFNVRHEWSPGVVTLAPLPAANPWFTLKPGSYPWPPALHAHFFQPTA